MYNELFHIGPLTVYGYGLMIAIGVIAAYLSAEYRSKKLGLDPEKVFGLVCWAAIGGIVGAKLMYYITELPAIIEDPSILLDVAHGYVVYGGILLGIVAGFLYCRRYKLPFLRVFDMAMPSIALAQGFGRIGCFLAGCCYGKETSCALHITFHNSQYAPNDVALVPTQLMASGTDFLHFFILIFLAKRIKTEGAIAGLYLTFYSLGRFILEFFRGDLERGSVGNLSTSQFISIFTFAAGIILVFFMRLRSVNTRLDRMGRAEKPVVEEAQAQDKTEQES